MVDVDVYILSHLKEELAWAVDKQLGVILVLYCYLKNSKSTKEPKEICYYVALGNVFELFQDSLYNIVSFVMFITAILNNE